ncbi:MAG TPA: hypothetical protein VHD90_03300 [Phototrophicaceae bacterium]|nr:hypothetical protein [Phototrophicaceae bacterium]
MYAPEHIALIRSAFERLHTDLSETLPFTGEAIWHWMTAQHPPELWTHPRAFPFFLIPWWVENDITDSVDAEFQGDLTYASIAAYAHIRLVDNIMDGHAAQEYPLVGATGVFHLLFQAIYQKYFDSQHPFWDFFRPCYFEAIDATIHDGQLTDKTEAQFINVISHKTGFANIPLAAVCYRYNSLPSMIPWSTFIADFSRWHLMEEDVFDYLVDLNNQTPTFFLCEGQRRKYPDERLEAWVIREGLTWAKELMAGWMTDIKASGITPEALAYVEAREALQIKQYAKFESALESLSKLLSR